MRIVQLCESFSPLSETFIYDQVLELKRQGADCHVLTMNRCNEEARPFEDVHLAPWPGRWNVPRLWRRALATAGITGKVETHKRPGLRTRFRRHLERLRPDLVHAQFGPMGALVAPVTEALDIPLVVTFHGYDVTRLPRKEGVRKRYKALFSRASLLLGVSNHICSKLESLGAPSGKIRLLHGGTQIKRFTYSNPVDCFDGKTIRLLHVGRLVEKKSPLDLIDAFHHASKTLDGAANLHLTIAGDGPLREATHQRIKTLNLAEQIDCPGAVPHEEVQRLMRQSHLYTQHCKTASDGDQEGQGITFVEASATGLPIVTTRHNGIPDVVRDGETGYLVPEGDTEAMAERIAHLAQHPEQWEQMGRAGRQHIEANFDLSKQTSKLIDLYDEACKDRAPAAD